MFQALQCPSSGARQTAVAASGFHMNVEEVVFSARFRFVSLLESVQHTQRVYKCKNEKRTVQSLIS
jgi:hypothetical protein